MKLRKSTSTAELLYLGFSKFGLRLGTSVGSWDPWLVDGLFHLLTNGVVVGVVTHLPTF